MGKKKKKLERRVLDSKKIFQELSDGGMDITSAQYSTYILAELNQSSQDSELLFSNLRRRGYDISSLKLIDLLMALNEQGFIKYDSKIAEHYLTEKAKCYCIHNK